MRNKALYFLVRHKCSFNERFIIWPKRSVVLLLQSKCPRAKPYDIKKRTVNENQAWNCDKHKRGMLGTQ